MPKIDLDQLKACNEREWHRPYGGQITLNCEDVDQLIKAIEKACYLLACECDELKSGESWKDYLLSEVSDDISGSIRRND